MGARDARDLSPIDAATLPAELAPFARSLNGYLERIAALLASERAFAANAAHELRTPVAAARAQAQLIAGTTEGESAAAAARLVAAMTRLTRLIEKLLQLARAEAGISGSSGEVDALDVLRLLVAEIGGDIVLDDSDLDRLPIAADMDALAILLRNLIENAKAHGTGPVRIVAGPGPRITIRNPLAASAAFEQPRFAKGACSASTFLAATDNLVGRCTGCCD